MASLSLSEVQALELDLKNFISISTRTGLASWLGISERQLRYIAYAMSPEKKYKSFRISKRNGGEREISAPTSVLKKIQKRIAFGVDGVRKKSLISNGFEKGRSIFDHAQPHKRKSLVITADVKDFFPSINFGRVRGVFLSPPFGFNNKVATLLAQLCTDGASLPQGAPSSPSIANVVCVQFDRLLVTLAGKCRCSVTRYADDICFSTGMADVPKYIAVRKDGNYVPSQALIKTFKDGGFEINLDKFRVVDGKDALVTGLKYRGGIGLPRKWRRRLRTELNLLRKYGDGAEKIIASWGGVTEVAGLPESQGSPRILGKIGFLRWLDGKAGSSNALRMARSYPQLRKEFRAVIPYENIDLLVEGVTDKVLLLAALSALQAKGSFSDLKLNFPESAMKGGPDLEKTVRLVASTGARRNLTIALFDSDDSEVLARAGLAPQSGVYYRAIASGVYVMALKPPPWMLVESFCIENLLRNDTFSVEDSHGRRMFLANEFSENGLHQSKEFFRTRPNKKAIVVDSDVYSVKSGKSMALAKYAFSELVANGQAPEEDYYGFHGTFSLIQEVSYDFALDKVR
ncbi:RNA-directed DNA polymerase [Xanthomonas sp. F14]